MEWTRKNIFDRVNEEAPDKPLGRTYWTSVKKIALIPDTYRKFCAEFFFHPGGKALRLNNEGVKVLSKFFIPYKVEVLADDYSREKMPSKHLVFLTRYCKAPYYIGKKEIIFFDEDEALIFKLCDGDIDNVKTVTD